MSNQYIYIVGKGDPQGSMVRAIRQAGYKVGLFHDQTLKLTDAAPYDAILETDFAHPDEALQSSLKEHRIAGLVCTYENYILAKANIAQYLGLPSLSVEAASYCTDKYLMRSAFARYDQSLSPDFALITSQTDAQAFVSRYGFPVIIKPTNLVKSLLVLRCNNDAELAANLAYAQDHIEDLYAQNRIYDRQPQLIIEQYVTGTLCSVAAFVDAAGESHFCEGVAKLVNATEVGYDDDFLYSRRLPMQMEPVLEDRIFAAADSAVRALDLRSSPAHIELIYTPEGDVKVIEVGARIGGYRPRMYALSYGLDLPAQEVALALGSQPDLHGKFRAYSAVYELFPKVRGTFKEIKSKKDMPDTSLFAYYRCKARPGKVAGPAKEGFRTSAIIIVSDADKTAFEHQCRLAESLYVEVTP